MKQFLYVLLSTILVAVAGFLIVASAWHETGKCSGQGCLIMFPVAGVFFLAGYGLLVPAYFWLVLGRAWWGGVLAVVGVALSFGVLYKFAAVFDVRMHSAVFGWYLTYPEQEWPVQYLLWAQLCTLGLLFLKYPLHRLAQWLSTDYPY
ncbi:hypothetical protein [Hymenobacter weizhouensis]|uniref:hypothetical protein n=1 Tax=Hymenobacter sp. YIM 151500-1 TaxID=2987689 RepID=UPI0022266B6C|nr:hypothetical protein [Hymenobacter sp. YIM 151500-1]UYZ62572.1 hypothetical protein OIS53_16420 [Hymenobacter sp. YIM 151500-1]